MDEYSDFLLRLRGFLYPAVVHEIRNIFSNIKICCDYSTYTDSTEKRESLLSEIKGQVERGTKNILELFCEIGNPERTVEKKTLNFPDDVRAILKLIRTAAGRNGVSMEIKEKNGFSTIIDPVAFVVLLGRIVLEDIMPYRPNGNGTAVIAEIGNEACESVVRLWWENPDQKESSQEKSTAAEPGTDYILTKYTKTGSGWVGLTLFLPSE